MVWASLNGTNNGEQERASRVDLPLFDPLNLEVVGVELPCKFRATPSLRYPQHAQIRSYGLEAHCPLSNTGGICPASSKVRPNDGARAG